MGLKLVIQIPCFNESGTLAVALAALPRAIPGISKIEFLVVDDGSTDNTAAIAKAHGVDHVVRHTRNRGLAAAFMTGIHACLERGADIIVNTDADNQYVGADIEKLVAPIMSGEADVVVGARPIAEIPHFSPLKKQLQWLGSWVVRKASNTTIPDAPSGFRAFTRNAAARLNVFNDYTYTLETIIQAGLSGLAIISVPIRVNGDLRPSRLVKSIPAYVQRSILTILRIFILYRPLPFFLTSAFPIGLAGLALCVRWLVLFSEGTTRAHVPSLIAAAILLLLAALLGALGLLSDLQASNRKILEEIQWRLRLQQQSAAPGTRPVERARPATLPE